MKPSGENIDLQYFEHWIFRSDRSPAQFLILNFWSEIFRAEKWSSISSKVELNPHLSEYQFLANTLISLKTFVWILNKNMKSRYFSLIHNHSYLSYYVLILNIKRAFRELSFDPAEHEIFDLFLIDQMFLSIYDLDLGWAGEFSSNSSQIWSDPMLGLNFNCLYKGEQSVTLVLSLFFHIIIFLNMFDICYFPCVIATQMPYK